MTVQVQYQLEEFREATFLFFLFFPSALIFFLPGPSNASTQHWDFPRIPGLFISASYLRLRPAGGDTNSRLQNKRVRHVYLEVCFIYYLIPVPLFYLLFFTILSIEFPVALWNNMNGNDIFKKLFEYYIE